MKHKSNTLQNKVKEKYTRSKIRTFNDKQGKVHSVEYIYY